MFDGWNSLNMVYRDGVIKMDCPVVRDNQILTKYASNQVLSLESESWMKTWPLKGIWSLILECRCSVLVGYISIVLVQLIHIEKLFYEAKGQSI